MKLCVACSIQLLFSCLKDEADHGNNAKIYSTGTSTQGHAFLGTLTNGRTVAAGSGGCAGGDTG